MTAKENNMAFEDQESSSEENYGNHTESNNKSDYLAQRLAAMGVSTDTQEFEDEEMDLELCDLSDSEYENSYDEEDDEEKSKENEKKKIKQSEKTPSNTQHNEMKSSQYDMDLVLYGDGEEEIDSDEERDLLKEIREEIQNKVKEEMKEEILMYKAKIAAIEQGEIPGDEKRKEKEDEEEETNLDPKIQEALIKMRKLDRILMKKMKREKEVKRERILLERRIREEIQNIKPEGREHKDVKCNTDKFVALALPPSHNEGVPVDIPPATPVFQTQLNEADFEEMTDKANKRTNGENDVELNIKSESSSTMGDNSSRHGDANGKKKKDFIKRNKELAANADETIAMTDEERKRVGDLLNDLDSLAELPEEMEDTTRDDANPFKMMPITPGHGYCGDDDEIKSMTHIDGRLRELLPDDEFQALVVPTPQESFRDPQHKLFTHVDVRSVGEIERYGEKALLENKEQREMQARLQKIEEQLARFHNPEEIEIETPHLTEDAMKGLIVQCVRSLSRSSYTDNSSVSDATPRSEMSSVMSVLENPPHLPDDVLQRLLAEAHFPLSSRLEALWEEEEKEDEGIIEQGVRGEQISAETWKVIVESDVYENEHSNDLELESLSRSSSRNTLRSSGYMDRPYLESSRQSASESVENRLILPEINQSPFLVSQGMNNYLSKNETNYRRNQDTGRESINMVRNNLSEANGGCETERDSVETVTPRPPSTDRRSNTDYSSRSRTVTPLS